MTKDSLDLAAMVDSWQLALSAERKSEHTVRNYTSGVRRFLRWCDSTGTEPVLDKTTVQTFITALLDSGVRPQVPVPGRCRCAGSRHGCTLRVNSMTTRSSV